MMSEVVSVDLVQQKVMSGDLPQVLHCTLSYLSVTDVCRLSSVCSTWNQLANKNQLWRTLCHRDGISVQKGMVIQQQQHHSQWCYYKSVYKEYSMTMKNWMQGKGVRKLSKKLQRRGIWFRGECLVICSRFLLTRATDPDPDPDTEVEETDHTIYVFDAVTGKFSGRLNGLDGHPKSVIVSKDESMVVAKSRNGSVVCVWRVETRECLHSLNHPGPVISMALHDSVLAVGVKGRTVFLWRMSSGQLQRQLCCTYPDLLVMDGQHIVIHDKEDGVLQLWNTTNGTHCFTWNSVGQCHQLLLDSDTKSLIGLSWKSVHMWDTETGACTGTTGAEEETSMYTMMIHNGTLVIGTDRTVLVVEDMKVAGLVHSLHASKGKVAGLVPHAKRICHDYNQHKFSCVGKDMVIISSVGHYKGCLISLWDMKRKRFVRFFNDRHNLDDGLLKINVLFNKLQIVKFDDHQLTYIIYDFSGSICVVDLCGPENE